MGMTTPVVEVPVVETPLTAQDRCDDACDAQAYVKVRMTSGGELLFCAHHWLHHESKLGHLKVLDEREKLKA